MEGSSAAAAGGEEEEEGEAELWCNDDVAELEDVRQVDSLPRMGPQHTLAVPLAGEAGGAPGRDTRRTSIRLDDPTMLRGTTPSVLLGGIGARMRGSVGGIGRVAETADDAYAKSFHVEKLDIFLSHSWHTWWLLKYLTLLYYFNAVPAIVASTFVGMCYMLSHYPAKGRASRVETADTQDDFPVEAQALGTCVFFLTLLLWHHVLAILKMAPTMFLDKVCIHQTNSALKLKGIKSIGAILANSQLMLVTWDSTYFERLWCTYEMSAFRKGNPDGKITVLPVVLGLFVPCFQMATVSACLLTQGLLRLDIIEKFSEFPHVCAVCHLPMFVLTMRVTSRYINNLKKLKMQLATFSVRSAKCFCCDAQHVHPETGAYLPCDREVVNNSIENWMGSLETFDRMVRGDFKRYVKRTLGGKAKIPYRYAVAASFYPSLFLIDQLVARPESVWLADVVFPLEATFLRQPLNIAATVAFLVRYQERLQYVLGGVFGGSGFLQETAAKWSLYVIAGLFCSALHYILLLLAITLVQRGQFATASAWILFEAACISSLYFGGVMFLNMAHHDDNNVDPDGADWWRHVNSDPRNTMRHVASDRSTVMEMTNRPTSGYWPRPPSVRVQSS